MTAEKLRWPRSPFPPLKGELVDHSWHVTRIDALSGIDNYIDYFRSTNQDLTIDYLRPLELSAVCRAAMPLGTFGNSALLAVRSSVNGDPPDYWTTDGISAINLGIQEGTTSGQYATPIELQGRVIMIGKRNGQFGVYSSDLTQAGTYPLVEFAGGMPAKALFSFAGRAYFAVDDGVHGEELWESDGTAAGTTLVADLVAQGSAAPRSLGTFKDREYLITRGSGTDCVLYALEAIPLKAEDGGVPEAGLPADGGRSPADASTGANTPANPAISTDVDEGACSLNAHKREHNATSLWTLALAMSLIAARRRSHSQRQTRDLVSGRTTSHGCHLAKPETRAHGHRAVLRRGYQQPLAQPRDARAWGSSHT